MGLAVAPRAAWMVDGGAINEVFGHLTGRHQFPSLTLYVGYFLEWPPLLGFNETEKPYQSITLYVIISPSVNVEDL